MGDRSSLTKLQDRLKAGTGPRAYAKVRKDGSIESSEGIRVARKSVGYYIVEATDGRSISAADVMVQSNEPEAFHFGVHGMDDNRQVSLAVTTLARSPSDPTDSDLEIVIL